MLVELPNKKGKIVIGKIMTWGADNIELLLSVAGVVLALISLFIFNKRRKSYTQTIRSGDSSTNVQAGRDINVGTRKTKKDVEKE